MSLIGQCYRDLGQKGQARKMWDAAASMETVSKEVGTDCIVTGLFLCSKVLVFSRLSLLWFKKRLSVSFYFSLSPRMRRHRRSLTTFSLR